MAQHVEQKARAIREQATSKAHALIRQLADHAADVQASSPTGAHDIDDDRVDVILQTEVDGVRCILIRQAELSTGALPALSPREREIARLIARGHQNKVVADRLQISIWTVNTHVKRIYTKFGVSSRAAMARHIAALELFG